MRGIRGVRDSMGGRYKRDMRGVKGTRDSMEGRYKRYERCKRYKG